MFVDLPVKRYIHIGNMKMLSIYVVNVKRFGNNS